MRDAPPSVWQQRRLRIAQQNAERQARKRRPAPRARDDEDGDEEEDDRPRRGKAGKRSKAGKRGTTTHLMTHGGAISATIFALRSIAIVLIVASAFGNYVQFMGGWEVYTPISTKIVGLAIAYQLLCSIFQWGFKALGWWPLYGLALIASAVPSFLTYSAWVGPYLVPQIGMEVTLVAIGLATLAADALPEWVLVG